MSEAHPPLPQFLFVTVVQQARLTGDAWNARDPDRVVLACPLNSQWRNRSEFEAMSRGAARNLGQV